MTQAWDFVDAAVLWQTRSTALSFPIDEINFGKRIGIRIANVLRNDGIRTIGDLIEKTEAELLRNGNFGHKSLKAIKQVLAEYHLELKGRW